MIRCVIFDFDGPVVLSHDIKREGFFAAGSVIPNGCNRIAAIVSNSPSDSNAIFDRFCAESGISTSYLVKSYSNWCEERVLQCPELQGAKRVIQVLGAEGIKVHVNSATLLSCSRRTVDRPFGIGFLDNIHGGHLEKVGNSKPSSRCKPFGRTNRSPHG
jgi:beta-phosphoglucomutase-like phosphatase (HAD superfamily)